MPRQLVECVPNFSEGRDSAKVDAIVQSIMSVPDVVLLDRESDFDHNRCVMTFVGPPAAVAEAAIRSVEKAVSLIDLTKHQGAHPRIGAADVIPFIPIEGITMDECLRLAERVGNEIWSKLKVPVYFYEAAAKKPERVNLENIRRGQFEALVKEIGTVAARQPDVGDAVHPTAGATVVGVRKFLIAYNVNLGTPDLEIAKRIAKTIRFSSGGFRYVKSMGVMLAARNQAQVSINLTDFEQTSMHLVYETVRREAERYGVPVVGSEIVGLIPKKAIEMAAEYFLRFENFDPKLVLENRMADALVSQKGGLAEFLDALAAPTATPGGGSASAAAAAMAAALGAMVIRLAKQDGADPFEADRRFFTEAVERDSEAFQLVMAAYKRPKDERAPYVEEALHAAAEVPLEVAERTAAMLNRIEKLAIPAKFGSDVAVAKALGAAARTGALENVRINLESIKDEAYRKSVEERLQGVNLTA